ncbi:RecF/RecN/SMC N terminal domain-containing protein [Colletotrichum graminicola]|uniref:RecF/RecN/SMC N terminal domain-containing protein n=1 Tax=Colletotrichum graminicola (strain M1.001 / M2 / FGSC 10212) TaxID=645133 RepID=E3QLT2_COLGM|nr:RecF/RecN/SMC N terminal domain-containing protein [Colletotrichum graminicola M1.001]EFQ31820.1 RecF/RecN/SMC N terminal domain-containing protein [Colletotrichum graminicola M1.001]WDK13585.1 RecF/RecN/SMC N terminal domain-containing protein [Colletotrichum graminicola]
MAPAKRPHAALESASADNEVLDVQHARSYLSQDASSKRARLSYSAQPKQAAAQKDEAISSDSEAAADDQDDEEPEERAGRDSPPRTQYEIARDNGFRHLQYEDQDDQRATQKIKSRPQRIGENHAAENGIIESVECINFMCHERLYVELGPLINFIVGENGSGKSAVLTALTLCLGGKASSTNRGGSLKSFIKEGQANSVIIVKIKNQGIDAYQHDLYGDAITVERHFSRTGASGFKLKSVTGKTVSTKKADVDEISEYWALQVDNPLNVLSQDNARQFLNSSSPSMKYKFFVRGVQLEQLDNDYKLLTEILESHEAKLPSLEEHVRRAKREHIEAQKLKDIAQRNEEMRKTYRRLRNQLYWSQVAEQEDTLAKYNNDIAALDEEIRRAVINIEHATQALIQRDEQLERTKTTVDNESQEIGAIQERIEAADAAYQDAKKSVTDIHHQLRDVQQRLKNAGHGMAEFESKIQAEEQRLGAGAGSARQEQEILLNEAKAEEVLIKEQMAEENDRLPQLRAELAQAQKAADGVKHEFDRKRGEISSAEGRLRNLEQNRGSLWAAYDKKIPLLLQAIEKDNGFQERPVGPIGAHVQLTRPEWSPILETVFGATLDGFLVSNKTDQQRLARLMQQVRLDRTPPIIIGKRLPPNVKLREPDPAFDTVLRVLKFDNDWVRSQLIVAHTIDKIVLIRERAKAQDVMMSDSPPPNVQACISFHDGAGKRGTGLRMARSGGAGFSQSPISPFPRAPRMKSDDETQINLAKESLAHLRGDLRSIELKRRELDQTVAKCKSILATQGQQNQSLERQLLRVQARIEDISAELDQYEGADGRLISLREELEKIKAERDHHGSQYGEMRLRQEELNKKCEECKKTLAEEKGRMKDFEVHMAKLQLAVQKAEDLRKMAVLEKNRAFQNRDDAILEKERAERKRDEQAEVVANFTQQAMEKAPQRVYIEEGETHRSIESKYATVHQQLEKRAQKLGASDEEIKERAARAEAAYEAAQQLYKGQQEEQAAGKLNLEDRLNRWRLFQRHISARARICFQYLLSERGFRGKLAIDHPQKRLQLFVEPDETRKGTGGRSTKTLSGGEKSFSSICMLLAIWEAMGSPLRCLDEFDVFMDNVNRTISTNMLITAARRSVSRQYIMITPNAIEGRATLDKDVKIIRLTDPRQRTLI